MVFLMILELCRLSVFTAYWDFLITDSVRLVKNTQAANADYAESFKKILLARHQEQGNPVLALFAVKNEKIDVGVDYAESIKDLVKENFRKPITINDVVQAPNGELGAIARYRLSYHYNYLMPLPWLPTEWASRMFNREIITVQEYERDKFQF
ncbi:protein TadE [Caviibacterium pharyngocola]|uniref:Protein TadE n=2 Tax=Caviibacterium pharyngocola TaxID=28159 RepID=A0A2M8RWW4_9PAST|nr:protein TadE [Caviibacterium pharyngocola]